MNEQAQKKPANFKDLFVWQKGMAIAKAVYDLTKTFPADERFGLVSQMRRAAVSIPSNLAEGQARRSTGEFIQFISIAEGSLAELETQLRLAVDLGFSIKTQTEKLFQQLDEERKMLNALSRQLITRPSSPVTRH